MLITMEAYDAMQNCIGKLDEFDSWRGKLPRANGFTLLEKESLRAQIFTYLLVRRKEVEGKDVNFEVDMAYLIWRVIRKALLWDAKPENRHYFESKDPNFSQAEKEFVLSQIDIFGEKAKPFIQHVFELAEKISCEEKMLYQVAKVVSNRIEFECTEKEFLPMESIETRIEIYDSWANVMAERYFVRETYELFLKISYGRHTTRWQGHKRLDDIGITGHMLLTAILGYMIALEEGYPSDVAVKAFYTGLLHDISEIWTDDIPSPCKDRMRMSDGKTLRDYAEEQEEMVLEEQFYPKLDEKVAKHFRENIIFGSNVSDEFHDLIKKADYFSADCEIWWNIVLGCRMYRFKQILIKSSELNRTPESTKLIKDWLEQISEIKFLRFI